MSSPRSRSGSSRMVTTARRKYRSSRNFPLSISCFRSALVAATKPGIDLNLLSSAHPLKTLLLKKAQKLHLNRRGKLADLIQKEGAAAGCFHQSLCAECAPR